MDAISVHATLGILLDGFIVGARHSVIALIRACTTRIKLQLVQLLVKVRFTCKHVVRLLGDPPLFLQGSALLNGPSNGPVELIGFILLSIEATAFSQSFAKLGPYAPQRFETEKPIFVTRKPSQAHPVSNLLPGKRGHSNLGSSLRHVQGQE